MARSSLCPQLLLSWRRTKHAQTPVLNAQNIHGINGNNYKGNYPSKAPPPSTLKTPKPRSNETLLGICTFTVRFPCSYKCLFRMVEAAGVELEALARRLNRAEILSEAEGPPQMLLVKRLHA